MTAAVGTLSINLIANTGQFNQAMIRSQVRIKQFSGAAGSAIATLGRFAAPVAVVAGIRKMTSAQEDFNQSLHAQHCHHGGSERPRKKIN